MWRLAGLSLLLLPSLGWAEGAVTRLSCTVATTCVLRVVGSRTGSTTLIRPSTERPGKAGVPTVTRAPLRN